MKKKLKEHRGDFTINGALIMLLVVVLVVGAIEAIGVGSRAMRLHNMATELSRYVELRGRVDTAVYDELNRLESATGIQVESHIDADYISGTSKIQFGNTFKITLSCEGEIGLGGILNIRIPLRSVVSGRSEQYWQS